MSEKLRHDLSFKFLLFEYFDSFCIYPGSLLIREKNRSLDLKFFLVSTLINFFLHDESLNYMQPMLHFVS